MQISQIRDAIECARDLISSFQHAPGPVDVIGLARKRGVSAVEPVEMSADGYLGRTRDGALVIRYRATNNPSRNRFTIAHEIAHLVLAEVQGEKLQEPRGGRLSDPQEETAVNRIAAELLMPAKFIWNELAKREQRGELPSWKIINALRQTYQVSASAMAFRTLELSSLRAISMRISIDGHAPQFPFDRSEDSAIRLVNGVEFEMERLWRDARKSTRHVVGIKAGCKTYDVPCEGLVKSMTTRLGPARHYWVIGWLTDGENEIAAENKIKAR